MQTEEERRLRCPCGAEFHAAGPTFTVRDEFSDFQLEHQWHQSPNEIEREALILAHKLRLAFDPKTTETRRSAADFQLARTLVRFAEAAKKA